MVRRSDLLGGPIPDNISEEEVTDLERAFAAAGGKVGVGGYDRVLMEEAHRSAARAQVAFEAAGSREEAGSTAAAVLCSAAACEARLSEYLAHSEFARGKLPEELRRIRQNRNARHQWRDLIRHVRPDIDLGENEEYRRLGCLFQLRDLAAHRNARLMELGALPDRIEPCVRQRTLPIRKAENADWTSVVFVHEVAVWAVETAQAWLDKADDWTPLRC